MSKCRRPIIVSNALQLINDLIKNTEYQVRFNSFKHKYFGVTEKNGKAAIQKGYWSVFIKSNGHRLNLVRPQKFGLDRTNWCKYAEFYDMYDSIEMALSKAKFMTMLEEPEWQDKDGNRVEFESEGYGCKLTSKITRPDMVLLGDEVVSDLYITGDGNIGGEKLLCEKGCISQRKATRKAKHFTVIGLTKLLGEPICCILIIEGKEKLFGIRAGIDSKEKFGYESDGEEYFHMNIGSSKYHPGEPSCTYKGKTVPCLVKISEVGVYQGILSRKFLGA